MHIFRHSQTDEPVRVIFRVPHIIDYFSKSLLGRCGIRMPSPRECAKCLVGWSVHPWLVGIVLDVSDSRSCSVSDKTRYLSKKYNIYMYKSSKSEVADLGLTCFASSLSDHGAMRRLRDLRSFFRLWLWNGKSKVQWYLKLLSTCLMRGSLRPLDLYRLTMTSNTWDI